MQENSNNPQSQSLSPDKTKANKKTAKVPTAPKLAKVNQSDDADTFFGNLDVDQEHPLPSNWQDQVCVLQCIIEPMNRGIVEVPNTHQYQTYSPALYEKLSSDSKGQPSFFSENKMKIVVLHDPRQ